MKNFIFPAGLKLLVLVSFFSPFAITGCDTDTAPEPVITKLSSQLGSFAKPDYPGVFVAPMDGSQEATPNNSKASGNAIFQLSKDGTELHYKLIVANIQNVLQAHIHSAPVGENGPIVVWLYPSGPPAMLIPGRSSGVLATGVITSADLVGPLAGLSLEDLLLHMTAGDTYVNVHTLQLPGGEIRGQIK
ncbi:CHRD domain-containing protein [Botryobacter ruber]|uniref:CHRD domain-containing protein n=1 Tax=Botryobacter ruber TaxID=2171629 RepID=UPI001F0C91B6|nr:CHRD domain-containing protein [Botryobacter ruber]